MFSWSAADLLALLRRREGHRQAISQCQAAVPVDDRKIRVKFRSVAYRGRQRQMLAVFVFVARNLEQTHWRNFAVV